MVPMKVETGILQLPRCTADRIGWKTIRLRWNWSLKPLAHSENSLYNLCYKSNPCAPLSVAGSRIVSLWPQKKIILAWRNVFGAQSEDFFSVLEVGMGKAAQERFSQRFGDRKYELCRPPERKVFCEENYRFAFQASRASSRSSSDRPEAANASWDSHLTIESDQVTHEWARGRGIRINLVRSPKRF